MKKPTKFLVCRKVLPNLLEHVTKRAGPDILALQVQTVQLGVNLVCLQNLRSVILPNEQFVSYYGIRHIVSHETKSRSAYTSSLYPLQVYRYEIGEVDFYSRWLCIM